MLAGHCVLMIQNYKHRSQVLGQLANQLYTFSLEQNLNKQAYDLAKTLLKRTVQTIETCIANVSSIWLCAALVCCDVFVFLILNLKFCCSVSKLNR